MKKTIFVTACFLGMFAVILGAFGAHGLKNLVNTQSVNSFETGVRYQMYHAFLLFIIGLLPGLSAKARTLIFWLIVIGVLLFSFSIYLLALDSLVSIDSKKIAFLTPIGGVFLIAGWVILGYKIIGSKA